MKKLGLGEYPYWVKKTRKEHRCGKCDEMIQTGSSANWKSLFTGEKQYCHSRPCPKYERKDEKE